jgi:hypothetical protein
MPLIKLPPPPPIFYNNNKYLESFFCLTMVVQMLFTLNNHFFYVPVSLIDYFCLTSLTTSAFFWCFFCSCLIAETTVSDSLRRGWKYLSKALFVAEPVPPLLICSGVPATVKVTASQIHVTFHRRAHVPILLASGLFSETLAVPWWNGVRLILQANTC